MAIDSFLRGLVSKDKVFYNLFEQVVAEVNSMAEVLKELSYEAAPEQQAKLVSILKEKEKVNDEYVASIFNELSRNFITPFDREDVHALATALDDISDNIYTAAKKMILYKVNPVQPEIQKMAELISASCVQVSKAVTELKNMKNMRQMTDAIAIIKEIEAQSDDVFDGAVSYLYNTPEVDAKELIKRKEIFSKLESVSDKCEDAANVVESIIIKYA
jgi:uncharacterized protein